MTLRVPFDQFVNAVRRHVPGAAVYVEPVPGGARVSAADPATGVSVTSQANRPIAAVRAELAASRLEVLDGGWDGAAGPSAGPAPESTYVAAVAYRSKDDAPGLWMDAYAEPPSQMVVLRSLYDEFCQTGELTDVSFEEFVRLSHPTVVVATPEEMAEWIRRRETPEA